MALLVLLSIREEGSEEGEHPIEDEIGIYNLLVFLWAVEKKWVPAVSISNPVDTPTTSRACSKVARCLKTWRAGQGD
jgi:hypothetical protein